MQKGNVYSFDNNQLDIVDEAIDLMDAARSEVYEMNFAEALEVMKIERLDLLRESLYRISGHEENPTPTVFGKPIKKERQ